MNRASGSIGAIHPPQVRTRRLTFETMATWASHNCRRSSTGLPPPSAS